MRTFNEYQQKAVNLSISLDKFKKKYPDLPNELINLMALTYNGLGLGETGEVQGKIKKIIRDDGGIITHEAREAIKAELGDVLWYLASMSYNLGIPLNEVAEYNIEKLERRHKNDTLHGSGDNR